MADVAAYTDTDPITARGTPMARPKIGSSIVDVIGRTPMVGNYWLQKGLFLSFAKHSNSNLLLFTIFVLP